MLLLGGFRDDGDSWRGSRGPPRDDRGPPPRSGGGDRYSDDRGPPRRSDDREGGGRWRNREDDRDPGPWRRDGPAGGRSEGSTDCYAKFQALILHGYIITISHFTIRNYKALMDCFGGQLKMVGKFKS